MTPRPRLIRPRELVLLEQFLRSGFDSIDVLAATLDIPVEVIERSLRPALADWPVHQGTGRAAINLRDNLRLVVGLEGL